MQINLLYKINNTIVFIHNPEFQRKKFKKCTKNSIPDNICFKKKLIKKIKLFQILKIYNVC